MLSETLTCTSVSLQIFKLLLQSCNVARQKRSLLLQVLPAADLRRLLGMLWHLVQLVLELVSLNVQLHHVLLNGRDLALLVLSLSELRIRLQAALGTSWIGSLLPLVVIEATLEAGSYHLRHVVPLQLRLQSVHGPVASASLDKKEELAPFKVMRVYSHFHLVRPSHRHRCFAGPGRGQSFAFWQRRVMGT